MPLAATAIWPQELFLPWLAQDSWTRERLLDVWFRGGRQDTQLLECRVQSQRIQSHLFTRGLEPYDKIVRESRKIQNAITSIRESEGNPRVLSPDGRERVAEIKKAPSIKFIQIFYQRTDGDSEGDHTAVIAELPDGNLMTGYGAFLVIDATHMQFDFPKACQFDAAEIRGSGIKLDGPDYAAGLYAATKGAGERVTANGAVTAWMQEIKGKPFINGGTVRINNVFDSLVALGDAARSAPTARSAAAAAITRP